MTHLSFPRPRLASLLMAVWGLFVGTVHAEETQAEQERFFESEVRPLLARRCVSCHGEKKQQGELRLDIRAGLFGDADIVTPGKPEESRLIQVIQYSADDVQMPPKGKLPEAEIAVLTRWVKSGAYWPEDAEAATVSTGPDWRDGEGIDFSAAAVSHWAYRKVKRPNIPDVTEDGKVQTALDRFVLTRLEENGLSFSPEADRRTLLRRLSFDLWGVPPTIEEVEQFENNASPDAYEQLVDRMLASPLYGQRWARHWLDVARYADTKGYVFTEDRRYPFAYTYRDYVVTALNGDTPYNDFVQEQLAADQLGLAENDPRLAALGFLTVGPRMRNNTHDIIDDRIDLVGRGLLGMTIGCSRCHDHKSDPLQMADYYSLYGVFASTEEPDKLPVIGETDETPEYLTYKAELDKRQAAIETYKRDAREKLLAQARNHAGDYLQAVVKAAGKLAPGENVTFEHGNPRDKLTQYWAVFIAQKVKQQDRVFLPWGAFAALPAESFSQDAAALLDKYRTAQTESAPVNRRVWVALEANPPQSMLGVALLYRDLFRDIESQVDAARKAGSGESLADPDDEELRNVLYGPGSISDLPSGQEQRIFERDNRDQLRKLERNVEAWNAESPGAPPRAMVVRDRDKPVEPVIFQRGDPAKRGDRVPRRFLQLFSDVRSDPFENGSGRRELAECIASEQNPLTARVIVNRVWSWHFGRGLVTSPSDFGTHCDPSIHAELLDWLAWTFMHEDNWSLKRLHRRILLSATYRQSSAFNQQAVTIDTENQFYWRMNRRRLEFEPYRDALLAVSGRLDPRVGGRGVDIEKQRNSGRRSVYAVIDRNNFSPLLRTFDFPNPDGTSPGRPNTTVPQQALYAMNSPFVREIAEQLAKRPEITTGGGSDAQVHALYRIVFAREPSDEELQLVTSYLTSPDGSLVRLAQTLVMSNEFLFVD